MTTDSTILNSRLWAVRLHHNDLTVSVGLVPRNSLAGCSIQGLTGLNPDMGLVLSRTWRLFSAPWLSAGFSCICEIGSHFLAGCQPLGFRRSLGSSSPHNHLLGTSPQATRCLKQYGHPRSDRHPFAVSIINGYR